MIGDDWQVDFSTVHGAQGSGMTRVVFCDPDDPEQCRATEFFLDGLELEDLEWYRACSPMSLQYVERLANMEEESPGMLRKWNGVARALKGL